VPDSARPTRDEEASDSGALGFLGLMPYLTAPIPPKSDRGAI
jgi:hypothetical protein